MQTFFSMHFIIGNKLTILLLLLYYIYFYIISCIDLQKKRGENMCHWDKHVFGINLIK